MMDLPRRHEKRVVVEYHSKGGKVRSETKWMQKAVKKPGSLHKALGVPMDKRIPFSKLEKASHSTSPLMRKRADLALVFSKFRPEK